ncbi:hypothetical protein AMJ80_09365 [bacterium SM23_31]|nr:MAG: hypothetical protein AMJ80_09365 [bacterium SM23_31]
MNVLIIAAHPDDEVLGVGGTISRHVDEGDDVYTVIMSWGVASRYEPEFIQQQKANALNASKILSVNEPVFIGLGGADKRFDEFPFLDIIKPIEENIQRFKPDILYTHHRGDSNTDHQITFKATMSAARVISPFLVNKILCYETLSSTDQAPPFSEYTFTPNVFVNIEKYLDMKLDAMKCYKYEIRDYPHPRSLESIEFQAKIWGHKAACKAAEAFVLVREII